VLEPIDFDFLSKWGHNARLVEMWERLLGRLTDPGLSAATLRNLGRAYHYLGRFEPAIKLYEQALTIAREIGDRQGEGTNLSSLGLAYRDLGQVERAIQILEEALAIAREIGDRRGEGSRLGRLAAPTTPWDKSNGP